MLVCRPLIKLYTRTMIKCKGKHVKTCQCEYRFECVWEFLVTECFFSLKHSTLVQNVITYSLPKNFTVI